ncbi:hypothetical protein [Ferrimicrobium acidiphilum]|uniref:hypothetical protein n=1 Tax=Ferrimicrobium acidiphilum TaxID=121039 RepID=UPI0023F0DAF2|nr:hypothetical protein [Ferrimicrobium acidiphilum]
MTNTPIDPLVIIELTNLKASGKLEELAGHSALVMKPAWIEELAQNKDYEVRRSLAANPAIANYPEVIQTLSTDKDWSVRSALALNPAIPSRTASTNSWQTTQPATSTPTI